MAKKTNTKINGKDYFRVTATVGKDPDGKNIRKQFYGTSKKEAENKRDEYLLQLKRGLSVNFDKTIFINVFDMWFNEVLKSSISITSLSRYECDYRIRIKNSLIYNMRLADITSLHIQSFYNDLNKNYTPNTVKCTHKLLSKFYKYCMKSELIIKNPLTAVELPLNNNINEKRKFLNKNEINKLIEASNKNINNFIFVFALFTGLRQGEILALTHNDVDLESNVIYVSKTVKFLTVDGKYAPLLTSTKTKSSLRQVPILEKIQNLIKIHIKNEKQKHLKLGIPFNETSIFFSSELCRYRDTRNVKRSFDRLLKKLDIPQINLHALRHTFCSLLAEQGVSLKTASILMGHSNINITAQIYTHVTDDEKKNSIAKLSNIF